MKNLIAVVSFSSAVLFSCGPVTAEEAAELAASGVDSEALTSSQTRKVPTKGSVDLVKPRAPGATLITAPVKVKVDRIEECNCGGSCGTTYFHTSSANVDCTNACNTRSTAWMCGNCSSAGQDCIDPAP